MKHHKNILKSNIIIKFLLKYLLVSLILTIAILAHTNFAKATSYQRDPAGTLIPNGTSVTVTASGIDFSSVCGVGNSWGLYMLRSDSVNPNGAILSDSLNGTGGSMTWTFTNLPSGGYAEVGAICYTGTAGALGNNPYYSYVYFNNQRAKIVLESGTPAFTVTPLTITTTMLPDARVAVAFSQTLQATNGAVPFTWSILSGSLPAGLSLNSSTGKISGIPTTVETANFIVKVTDTTSAYATRELSLRVLPEIIISTASFLTDTVGSPYSKTLGATGGALPYSWSVILGSLPNGLSLNSSNGEIFGTPNIAGTFNFTVQVTDAGSKTATKLFSFVVISYKRNPSSTSIPSGTSVVVTATSVDFSSVCGVGNSWGLYMLRSDSVNPNGAILSDTRNGTGGNMMWTFTSLLPGGYSEIGAICYTFTASTIGNNPYYSYVYFNNQRAKIVLESGTPAFTVVPFNITTTSLSDATVAVSYLQAIQTIGGTAPLTWLITAGSLPAGLSLNPSTGIISGTPTKVETANFTVRVTDANNNVATKNLSIIVHGNTPPGSNIVVGPLIGITLTFSQITAEGQTTIASSSSGTNPPSGFKLGNPPTYYSISTTAVFIPPVTVCINYNPAQFKNTKNIKLFHFENGAWVNVTTSLDTVNHIVCGRVSSFSDFVLVENLTVDYLIDEVKDFHLQSGIEQSLLAKLNAAKSAVEKGQTKTAQNILKAFVNEVQAQRGKKITDEQANLLTTDAQTLITSLGGNFLFSLFKFILFGWLDKLLSMIYNFSHL